MITVFVTRFTSKKTEEHRPNIRNVTKSVVIEVQIKTTLSFSRKLRLKYVVGGKLMQISALYSLPAMDQGVIFFSNESATYVSS